MNSTSRIRRNVIATAVCLALQTGAATALELGQATVTSRLGEPLGVTIPVRSAPALTGDCIAVSAAPGSPAVPGVRAALGGGVLTLTSQSLVREPLLEVIVRAGCPGDVTLSRSYILMFDLPGAAGAAGAIRRTDSLVEPRRAIAQPADRSVGNKAAALRTGTTYRVRPGDTLSGIAERVDDPQRSIWATADAIFRANPDAFVGGNPDRLKAGVVLSLPGELVAVAHDSGTATEPAQTASPTATPRAATRPETAPPEPARTTPATSSALGSDYADRMLSALGNATGDRRAAAGSEAPVEAPAAVPSPAPAAASIAAGGDRDATEAGETTAGNAPQAAETGGDWTIWLRGVGIAALVAALFWFRGARRRGPAPQPAESNAGGRRARIDRDADLFERYSAEPGVRPPATPAQAASAPMRTAAAAMPAEAASVPMRTKTPATPAGAASTPMRAEAPATPAGAASASTRTQPEATPALAEPAVPAESVLTPGHRAAEPDDTTAIDVRTIPERTVTVNTRAPEVEEQSLLEQDYEEEYSRTQKLRKQLAAQALQQSLAALSGDGAEALGETAKSAPDPSEDTAITPKRRLADNLTDELFNSMILPGAADGENNETVAMEPIVRDDLTESTVALPNLAAHDAEEDDETLLDELTLEFDGAPDVDAVAGGSDDVIDEQLDELTAKLEQAPEHAPRRKKQA